MRLESKLLLILDLCIHIYMYMHVCDMVYIHINPSKIIDGEPVKNILLSCDLQILKTFFLLFVFISEYTIQHYIFSILGLWLFYSWGYFLDLPAYFWVSRSYHRNNCFLSLTLWSHSILCWRLFVMSSILFHSFFWKSFSASVQKRVRS